MLIDDYINGKIKKYELICEEKELDWICYVDVCDVNISLIFFIYCGKEVINVFVEFWVNENEFEYDFESFYGVVYKVWVIMDVYILEDLLVVFLEVLVLYIVDGYYRMEFVVKVGLKWCEEFLEVGLEVEFNFFLLVVFLEE